MNKSSEQTPGLATKIFQLLKRRNILNPSGETKPSYWKRISNLFSLLRTDPQSLDLLMNSGLLNDTTPTQQNVLLANMKILTIDQGQGVSVKNQAPFKQDLVPIPWYTYPAIEYLNCFDFSNKTVFEWGSGNSTLYWSQKAKNVTSVDNNKEWHIHVASKARKNINAYFIEKVEDYVYAIEKTDRTYDVIVIDGQYRYNCALSAVKSLAGDGLIILDNSDWYPHTASFLRENGLLQVDFHGFGPIIGFTWTCSLFFRQDCRLQRNSNVLVPVGGQAFTPPDDSDVIMESYKHVFYSQEGEDIMLREFLASKKDGFYVDIGAHHPARFSNTQYYYDMGWNGINIDPAPGTKILFDDKRPRDINLEIGISSTAGELPFYVFNDSALNTSDKELAREYASHPGLNIEAETKIRVDTLENVLNQHASGRHIDFLSVDAENHEIEILQSNNWDKYRPDYIIIEVLDFDINRLQNHEVNKFLVTKGYQLFAKTLRTCFYKADGIA
jgi:FkbM family methyltransferase